MSSPSPPPGPGPPTHSFFTLKSPPKQRPSESSMVPQISISYSADAMKADSDVRPSSSASSAEEGGVAVAEWGYIHDPKWTVDYTRPVPQASSIENARELGDMSMVGIAPTGPRSRTAQLHPRFRGTGLSSAVPRSRLAVAHQTSTSKAAKMDIPSSLGDPVSNVAGNASTHTATSEPETLEGAEVEDGSSSKTLPTFPPSDTDTTLKDVRISTSPSPKPALTISQATKMLRLSMLSYDTSTLLKWELSFSVALYSPLGSFLPPLQPLTGIGRRTTLKDLVLALQQLLTSNLRHAGSNADLLVQSIEIRTHEPSLEKLPRIEGWLSGSDDIEGGMELGLGIGAVETTSWVAWDGYSARTPMTPEGRGLAGDFWYALMYTMVHNAHLREAGRESVKSPMLKVRTVVHRSRETHLDPNVRGKLYEGHVFFIPPGAVPHPSTVVAENAITPRGSIASEGGKDVPKEDGPKVQDQVIEPIDNPSTLVSRLSASKHGRESPDSFKSTASTQHHKKVHKYADYNKKQQPNKPQTLQVSLGSFMPATATIDQLDAAVKELQDLNPNRKVIEGKSISVAEEGLASRLWKKLNQDREEKEAAAAAAAAEDSFFEEETIVKDDPTGPDTTTFPINIDDKTPEEMSASKGEKDYYTRVLTLGSCYGDSRHFWVEEGGYPKNVDVEVDPEHNWEKFQCWGEKPSDPGYEDRKVLHEWFSLRHVPFYGPVCRPWNQEVKDIYRVEEYDEHEFQEESSYQMVPYEALDPKLMAQHILESVNEPSHLPLLARKHWFDHHGQKGLSEYDDDTFFPAWNPEFVRKSEASRIFQAQSFKNPGRKKKFDISTVLSATERRVSSNQSRYLDALAATAEKASEVYENMLAAATLKSNHIPLTPGTAARTFNHKHAAANNVFQSAVKGVESFAEFLKQDDRPVGQKSLGFYELSRGVANHTPVKDADAFVADLTMTGPELQRHTDSTMNGLEMQSYAEENNIHPIVPESSFGEFSAMANEFMGEQSAVGAHEDFNTMADGNFTSDEGILREQLFREGIAGANMFGRDGMGGDGGVTPAHMSFDTTIGEANGGQPEYRNSYANYFNSFASAYPNNQGWTSMNTAGATYNSFGGQSNASAFNPRTAVSTTQNRGMNPYSPYTGYNQTSFPTPTPANRTQSRFFNAVDTSRSTAGHERFAFNDMSMSSSNPNQPTVGSFVNALTSPTNANHPYAGPFIHGGIGARSRTHNLHLSTNPAAASRARRPIPIIVPNSNRAKTFQLPSPTRQAIGYGAGLSPTSLDFGLGTRTDTAGNPGLTTYVRRTPSPEKKAFQKASIAAFGAAIESAFNGPNSKGNPSAAGKKG